MYTVLVQSLLITGAAAALGSAASCGSTTSGMCCSNDTVGQLAPSFACNATAACCAACFNDMRCTSWTLEIVTTTASSLCTLQSSCTATKPGNCTRGELRPRPHARPTVDASAAAAVEYATWRDRRLLMHELSHTLALVEAEEDVVAEVAKADSEAEASTEATEAVTETNVVTSRRMGIDIGLSSEWFANWRGRHRKQRSRWAAAWATARRRSSHYSGPLWKWRNVAPWYHLSRTVYGDESYE